MDTHKTGPSFEAVDLGAVLGMFQEALKAKARCIDSLQAVTARQSEELALAWANIEKERQARLVAEDGVKALQWALDKSREELRKEMLTRRADHNKLLHQFSCEWHVLEELEAEQAKRAAAEMALHLTQAWMDKTLLRCEQLQQQHRLHRQQIKAAQSDRDARWQVWARHAAAEHEQVRQLCQRADVALPDFWTLLTRRASSPPHMEAHSRDQAEPLPTPPGKDPSVVHSSRAGHDTAHKKSASLPGSPRRGTGGFGSDCEAGEKSGTELPSSEGRFSLSKSGSWSELGQRNAPPVVARPLRARAEDSQGRGPDSGQADCRQAGQGSCSSHGSFEFIPPLQAQTNQEGAQSAEKKLATFRGGSQHSPASTAASARSAALDSKWLRSPNKTPRPTGTQARLQDFGGLVKRIVGGSGSPLEAKSGNTTWAAGLVPRASNRARAGNMAASKSAPTSPLRRVRAAVGGPTQGLKDLMSDVVFQDPSKWTTPEKLRDSMSPRRLCEPVEGLAFRRSYTIR